MLVRAFRLAANLTQTQLATAAGVGLTAVSQIETGHNTTWETLTGLSQALRFNGFIELCRAENREPESLQTRALLRAWRALPTERARLDALSLVAGKIVEIPQTAAWSEGTTAGPRAPVERTTTLQPRTDRRRKRRGR